MGVLQSLLITPQCANSLNYFKKFSTILDSHKVHYAMYRCDAISFAKEFALQCKQHTIYAMLNTTLDTTKPLAILDSPILQSFDGIHLKGAYFAHLDSIVRHYSGIIGFSAHSVEEVYRALQNGAHYCTLSPIFPTPDKPTPLGLDSLHSLSLEARKRTFALGGIISDLHIAQIASVECIKGFGSIRYFSS